MKTKAHDSMEKNTGVDRRQFLYRMSLTMGSAPLLSSLLTSEGRAADVVNFASYGGSYNDSIEQAFVLPFEKETGIDVVMGANASLALAKLQADINPAQWDIVELAGAEFETAVKSGLLLEYDYNVVNAESTLPAFKKPYGVMYALYLLPMAWDQRKIPDSEAPTTWAEFWDISKYPGKRSLSQKIADNPVLEFALLADGVPMDQLYPLDVERALQSFDKLGKDNIVWQASPQEGIQHLTSGEAALAAVGNGRIIIANRGGAQIGFRPEYGAVFGDYLGVMKTTGNPTAAFKFISYVLSKKEANAEFMKITSYATPNQEALELVPTELADTLPTSPKLENRVFYRNDSWWAENYEQTLLRFKQWQLT